MPEQNDPAILNDTAVACAKKGDMAEAISLWEQADKLGSAAAANNLGLLYIEGKHVPQDKQVAFACTLRAAERGFPEAQGRVSVMYADGMGVAQNPKEAYIWVSLAGGSICAISQTIYAAVLSPDELAEANKIIQQRRAKMPN